MQDDIIVQLGERSYPIRFRAGGLNQIGSFVADLTPPGCCAILTDENVGALYVKTVADWLEATGYDGHAIVLPPGEEQKSLSTVERICREMVRVGLDRKSLLVALGGGVIGDIGGFVAATYMRGIPYLQIPTSLLAQVDSSVGGKTAVNLPEGKNLIGAFHQPVGVFIDVSALATLPAEELRFGMVEVVKYGIIRDARFFAWLERDLDKLLRLDADAMLKAVRRCCEIKAEVVAADEREGGLRAILNYGHTTGHALEALSGYATFTHGEAVAIGMEVAAALSKTLLRLSEADAARQHELLKRLGVPTSIRGASADAILSAMMHDKKTISGRLRLVLARRIGEVEICDDIPAGAVREALIACGAMD